jgi:hypothetical protein
MPDGAYSWYVDFVHGAFKEAGFLADAHRPLKVRRRRTHLRHHSLFVLYVVSWRPYP